MEKIKSLLKNQKTYIVLLLLVTGVFFFLRSVNRELIYVDEIIYGYNLNATQYYEYWASPQTSLDGKIETFSDVIDSQINHYFYGNGRSIVHAIQQLFTGIIGVNVFYIVNTIVFLLTIIYVAKFLRITQKVYAFLIVIMLFLYLYPMPYRLWYSINMACNYLWPMCFALILLYNCEKIIDNRSVSIFALFIISILAFITGWSHEAFAVPLSGAMFFYILFNLKKIDKRILCVAIPLWIGSCIMVFAPANIARFFGEGEGASKIYAIANAIDNFMHIKLLWVLIITTILFRIFNFDVLKDCFRKDIIIWYSLIVGILFGLIANTAPYSFTAIELFSFLLTFKLTAPLLAKIKNMRVVLVVLTIVFCVHQSLIVKGEIQQSSTQKNLISEYVRSEDGVVNYNVPQISWSIKPYVTIWKHSGVSVLYGGAIEFAYGNGKPLYALADNDYKALASPTSYYCEKNKFAGDAPFYYAGGNAYWAKASDINDIDAFEFEYEPVSFNYDVPLLLKIKFALTANSYPLKEEAEVKCLKSRWGNYYYILLPPVRKPIAINYKK